MNKKLLLSLVSVVFLLAGVATGVVLVRQQQLIQKEASTPEGSMTATLSPLQFTATTPNQKFDVDLLVDTNQQPISGVNLILTYTYDTNLPNPIEVDSVLPNQDLAQNDGWAFEFYQVDPNSPDGIVRIEVGATYNISGGYQSSEPIHFATIRFEAEAPGTIQLEYHPGDSKVIAVGQTANEGDDLLNDFPTGIYTASFNSNNPTATPTPTQPAATVTPPGTLPTNTPVPTNTPAATATPGPSATPGPTSTPTPNNWPAAVQVKITSLANGQTVNVKRPTISGTAAPGATIAVTINSNPTITGTATANAQGAWSYTPTQDLAVGNHTLTVTATDVQGRTSTAGITFAVSANATAGSGTPAPTTVATQTLPQAGSVNITIFIALAGFFLLITGLAVTKLR
jgi:hypothetical protein